MLTARKSLLERATHAIAYEVIALLVCTPLFAWLMDQPMEQMGLLNLLVALLALGWNGVFNALYDRWLLTFRLEKSWGIRVAHGVAFECGLTVMVVPLAAWWLQVSLWQAFLFDVGILTFFLPYTIVFNYGYDCLRKRVVG